MDTRIELEFFKSRPQYYIKCSKLEKAFCRDYRSLSRGAISWNASTIAIDFDNSTRQIDIWGWHEPEPIPRYGPEISITRITGFRSADQDIRFVANVSDKFGILISHISWNSSGFVRTR